MTGRGTEPQLRTWFRHWLAGLDDDQIAALAGNWENVMNAAALDRVDSWVIAEKVLRVLRGEELAPGQMGTATAEELS